MASPAYCIYCFETLSNSFAAAEPPRLSKVQELWDAYHSAITQPSREVMDAVNADEEEDEGGRDDVNADDDEDGSEQEQTKSGRHESASRSDTAMLQPPSISRLRATASPSGNSSSSSSTASLFTNDSSASSTTSYSSALQSQPPEPSYPVFVTWNTQSSRSNSRHLRGCIGTFEPLPISRGLETYALTSAFDDARFNPIPQSLLPQLSCSITLLADFTNCNDPLDWELGVHGIRISFTNKNGTRRYGATYLPDVAVEQGWTKEETVESLMRKAGWDGSTSSSSITTVGVARRLLRGARSSSSSNSNLHGDADAAIERKQQNAAAWDHVSDFKTVRYTGLRANASYADWQDWKRWVDENGLTKNLRSR